MQYFDTVPLLGVMGSHYNWVILGTIIATAVLSFNIRKRLFVFREKISRGNKWKSPFVEDSRKLLTPLETDKLKRHEIMKKGF
jgi:hypothetical protein